MRYFTPSHEWFDLQVHQVGLSGYAKDQLGEVVYLKMPEVGQKVEAGDELCILESTKAAADVYAPYSGVVVEVNPSAIEWINEDPEGKGWLVKIKPDAPVRIEAYLEAPSYEKLIQSQDL